MFPRLPKILYTQFPTGSVVTKVDFPAVNVVQRKIKKRCLNSKSVLPQNMVFDHTSIYALL